MARLSFVPATALALAALSAGCAGWSSWEDGRGGSGSVRPSRQVGADDYVVARGDTVYSIAFRHSLDYRELAQWNGIGSDYLIRPGQVLRLKPAGAAQTATRSGRPAAPARPPAVATAPPVTTGSAPAASASRGAAEAVPVGYEWVWPTSGSIVRGFGDSGSRGVDFSGRDGQPVFAAAPDRVVYSGNALKGYGELIIIKHDEVYLSAYGYNRSRHVKEGDVVTAGQPIAEMGRGPENKPLLHFEIRRKGKPIDPAAKLPAGSTARA
ncbi:MAG: peptidoglycan DD-metalloendopeptidase family protein, partial [Gammaproteobacteria bacterium]